MKRIILLATLIISAQCAFAQKTIHPILGFNFASSMLDEDRVLLSGMSLEPGIQINDRVFLNISIGYIENRNSMITSNEKFRGTTSSVSASFRLLDPFFRLSPLISVSFGNVIFANARGEYLNDNFTVRKDLKDDVIGRFDRFRYFAKGKFMLDGRYKNFNARFGPTFNIYNARLVEGTEADLERMHLFGMGLEFGVVYSFEREIDKEFFKFL